MHEISLMIIPSFTPFGWGGMSALSFIMTLGQKRFELSNGNGEGLKKDEDVYQILCEGDIYKCHARTQYGLVLSCGYNLG